MDVRAAPYPADTRAKGWRFELDYEQVEQSDTWPLAAEIPMCQHALLMMWLVAWGQVPCGSFPNDEAVIRAKCKVPPATWAKCRDVLMRGWWLAEDGRLYHDTLSKRVTEMMARRRSDSDRQAAKRAREALESQGNHADVTRDSAVTHVEVTPESSTDNRLPTKTVSSPASKKQREPRSLAIQPPDDVDPQVWADWLALRKAKKAPVSATVLDGARGQASKAGMTLEAFLRVWIRRGSQGLEADWLRPNERQTAAPSESAYARQMREKYEQIAPGIAAKRPGGGTPFTIDMESPNGPARILG